MERIRIGTRGSRLAVKQAELVQQAIRQADSSVQTQLVILHTKGDKILEKPLAEIGEKGVFTSEFEQALLEDRIDLAVHSAKDLPMRLAEGLTIGAVLPRADVRDVLVVKKGGLLPENCGGKSWTKNLFQEKAAARIPGQSFVLGTGSRRRQQQAQKCWPDIACKLIRGNVETRLNKLAEGQYDGIILAKAGLDRLEIGEDSDLRFDFWPLPAKEFLPAACQGLIAVEAKEDSAHAELLKRITDAEAKLAFDVEREVLTCLQADCSEAAAAWCRQENGYLLLDVLYGKKRVWLEEKLPVSEGKEADRIMTKKAPDGFEGERKALGISMARAAALQVR